MKIFVPGIYPDEYSKNYKLLPWAEPAMSIGGGAWKNENPGLNQETGFCSTPHFGKSPDDGAQVFLFFEAGDINKPVYFASAQSGPGWFSEHPNQHVFHSDNIRVRIDEEPEHPNSTCKFDSYNDKNCEASIVDKTKKQTKTRLDIEVLAEDLNAVNIQIHGDVNMKVLGDWYVHHEGSKHETHIGPTYIKHIGNTIIEEEGKYIYKHIGDHHNYIEGAHDLTVTENYTATYQQDYKKNIGGRATYNIGGDYSAFIGGLAQYKIIGNEEKILMGSYTAHIGGDISVDNVGNTTLICGGSYISKVVDSISIESAKGNIDLKTNGEFELLKDGNITAEGYKNIGTKGNIRITSTFGNIGIKTIENTMLSDFSKEYTCIPWNPSYLNQIGILSNIPGFDEDMIFENLDIKSDATNISSLITSLQKSVLFDGFPSFLPCKMILQNPNITTTASSGWISEFRSIDDDWNNISNTKYWKLLGKLMGNIEISSWNGDLSLTTQGTLGNSGNINIFARNKHGVLPGYQAGNIKMAADTPFRVFTDPRDLFFDSDLKSKIAGKFVLFSSASSNKTISIKPFKTVQTLLQTIGLPAEFGFTQMDSNGGGCIRCICDVLADLALTTGGLSISPWSVVKPTVFKEDELPLHKFNALSGSLVEPNSASSTKVLNGISNGYGHAVENYKLGETYETVNYPLGNVLINGVGSYQINAGKNFEITTKTKDWKFGVNSTVETGWVEPDTDEILVPTAGLYPTQLNKQITFTNEYNTQKFGNYTSKYNANMDTGVYLAGGLGCFGYEDARYEINTPSLTLNTAKMNLLLSSNDIVTNSLTIPSEFYSVYQTVGKAVADNITIGNVQNSYRIKLGDGTMGAEISGKLSFTELKNDLPLTAKTVETTSPVIDVLSKAIPGLGEAPKQAIKMLPKLQIPKYSDTVFMSPYFATLSGGCLSRGFAPNKLSVSGGLLSFPSSLPVLNFSNNLGFIDFSQKIDNDIYINNPVNLADPAGLLNAQINSVENKLVPLSSCAINSKVGLGVPKPIGDMLNAVPGGAFKGMADFTFISGGLSEGATYGEELDVLNGLAINQKLEVSLPLKPEELVEKPSLLLRAKTLKTGPTLFVSPTQSELNYDVFDKTLYTTVKAGLETGFDAGINVGAESRLKITTSHAEFKLFGLQIFKIPDLLGKALSDAILDLVN